MDYRRPGTQNFVLRMYYVSNQFEANVELFGRSKNHETHH